VGIIGATGYTGEEAINILLRHRQVRLSALTALPEECGRIGDIFPSLRSRLDMAVEPLELAKFAQTAEVALCCLPHKVSMNTVPKLLEKGLKVIDFSADYRLRDVAVYEKAYCPHTDPANLARAAFGLPELFRSRIVGQSLVANPGCYPTSAALGLAPLLKKGLIETQGIIVNAVTGVSGAGRKASLTYHLPEMNENLFAYAVGGTHRHNPEIDQICSDVAGRPVKTLFQPHVVAIDRGILSTIYAQAAGPLTNDGLLGLYREFYRNEPFVRVLAAPPALKAVARSNFCDLHPRLAVDGKTVIVFSAIDNLVKGASGQAVQNLNLICGFQETEGLL